VHAVSWIGPVLLAWAVLGVPGFLMLVACGVRLPVRWGWSPVVTVLMAVVLAAVLHLVHVPWRPLPVAVGASAMVVLVVLVRAAVTRSGRARTRPTSQDAAATRDRREASRTATARGRHPGTAPILAVTMVVGLLSVAFATGRMGGIDTLNGSYDAFFHHAAIAFVRDRGDAMMTTALTPIYGRPTLYPVVFSTLAALLPFDVVTSANAMMLACLAALPVTLAAQLAAGTWLVRPSFPVPAGGAVRPWMIALVASAGILFLSTPAMGLVMGLWPSVLGVLCLPPAIAAVVRIAQLLGGDLAEQEPAAGRGRADASAAGTGNSPSARDRTVCRGPGTRRSRALALMGHLMILGGAVLAHFSNLFALVLVAGLLLVVRGLLRVIRREHVLRGACEAGLALALGITGIAVSAARLGQMQLTDSRAWQIFPALSDVMFDVPRIPALGHPLWQLGVVWVLAVIGTVTAVRRLEPRGITAAVGVVVTVTIGVLTMFPSPLGQVLTNPWYGARERIAPITMCLLLVLALRGVQALAGMRRVLALQMLSALLVVSVIVGLVLPQRLPLLGSLAYTAYGLQFQPYAPPAERAFIERTAARLPADAVVLADPRDGAGLYWSLGGVDTVFPTLARPQTHDAALLGGYVDEADSRPEVCDAYHRIGPTHLYRDTSQDSGRALSEQASWPWRGIDALDTSHLRLIERQGPYALYEMGSPC
jgi:hypothetical protein